jgi:Homing endonuclease associated repeat/Phosphotransferase enzyme family
MSLAAVAPTHVRPDRARREARSSRRRTRPANAPWTEAEAVAALQSWAQTHGRAPTAEEWRYSGGRSGDGAHPQANTVRLLFGTYAAGVAAAGLEPQPPRRRRPSRDEILAALHAHVAAHGCPPRSKDWEPEVAGRPRPRQVIALFETFDTAVVAAGYRSRVSWSKEDLVDALRQHVAETGAAPSSIEWDRQPGRQGPADGSSARYVPAASTIIRRFGSWRAFLASAGLTPPQRTRPTTWPRPLVLDSLRSWANAHGRAPRLADWHHAGREGTPGGPHPAASTACRAFGSWSAALAAAGYEPLPPAKRWTKAEAISALQSWAEAHGRSPRRRDWLRAGRQDEAGGDHPTASTTSRLFGSWAEALAAAGLERDFHPGNVLWRRATVSGVVDWQAASICPASVDVANCRGNLFGYGLEGRRPLHQHLGTRLRNQLSALGGDRRHRRLPRRPARHPLPGPLRHRGSTRPRGRPVRQPAMTARASR